MRLRAGESVVLFNGRGGEYVGRVETMRPGFLVAVETYIDVDRESALKTTLVQGISRGERMDYTLQKSVELGVSHIVPVIAERTVVRMNADKAAKQVDRWRNIVLSACEQSGRTALPSVAAPCSLRQGLASSGDGALLLLDPGATESLSEVESTNGEVTLLIGPEGGLSDGERAMAASAGFRGVRLGPRVLRTETAAVTALAILQALQGDIRASV